MKNRNLDDSTKCFGKLSQGSAPGVLQSLSGRPSQSYSQESSKALLGGFRKASPRSPPKPFWEASAKLLSGILQSLSVGLFQRRLEGLHNGCAFPRLKCATFASKNAFHKREIQIRQKKSAMRQVQNANLRCFATRSFERLPGRPRIPRQ